MSLGTNLKRGMIWLTLCMTGLAAAGDIYVDDSAPGANNGTSWFHAYRFLRDALDVAKPGDTVKVGQGIYRPNQSSWGPITGRPDSFIMINGVSIMGGYKANDPNPPFDPEARDPNMYPSILSGDLDANDIPIDDGDWDQIADLLTHPTRQDNSYSVVLAGATEPNAVLDGFVIEGGNSNSDEKDLEKESIYRMGGGMAAIDGHATIRKCVFLHNAAAEGGGALYNRGNLNLDQCRFLANFGDTSGGYGGGAIVILDGAPVIRRSEFIRNLAGGQATGGAIKNFTGAPQISDCLFENNDGSRLGGAISSNGDAVITDCDFINNTASSGGALDIGNSSSNLTNKPNIQYSWFINNRGSSRGGAAYIYRSEPAFLGCYFIGNEAPSEGGAIYGSGAEPNFVNCIFNGNMVTSVSQSIGGGMFLTNTSNASIYNCTFAHNVATVGYGIACKSSGPEYASHVNIRNSILWNDTFDEVRIMDESTRFIGYTTMMQWDTSGPGNNTSNPMFVNATGDDGVPGTDDDDLRLRGGNASSSVDSGNNYWIPDGVLLDADKMDRRADDPATPDHGWGEPPLVDRGAYEYGSTSSMRPAADAGSPQTVYAGPGNTASVKLDGTGSYDPDGRPLSYRWSWHSGVAYGATPTVVLPVGNTLVTLVVNNGQQDSLPDTVTISVLAQGGQKPIAVAGDDQNVYTEGLDAQVTLDGSASYDPSGREITFYHWNWNVNNQEQNRYEVMPTITLPLGTHIIRLRVHNGVEYSDWDSVTITVLQQQSTKPVAVAGDDRTVDADGSGQAQVLLNGSGSYDPAGRDIVFYHWTWTVGAQVENRYSVTTTATLPVGVYTIRLRVHNGIQYSDWDDVVITVKQQPNVKPIADAGPDQMVSAGAGNLATNIQLDGSGSYDPSGRSLSYRWNWTVNNQNWQATGVRPVIPWLPLGKTVVTLVVSNGLQDSQPDTVTIEVLPKHEFDTWIYPGHITPYDDSIYVTMLMDIVGVPASDIDMAAGLTMTPGNLKPIGQHLTVRNAGDVTATLFAFWHEAPVLAANPTGIVTLTVHGQLIDGTPFTGSASVRVSH